MPLFAVAGVGAFAPMIRTSTPVAATGSRVPTITTLPPRFENLQSNTRLPEFPVSSRRISSSVAPVLASRISKPRPSTSAAALLRCTTAVPAVAAPLSPGATRVTMTALPLLSCVGEPYLYILTPSGYSSM